MPLSCRHIAGLCLPVLILLAFPFSAPATSVGQVAVRDLVASSELIFEGRVVGQRVERSRRPDAIFTYVTFEVLEIIKGDWPEKRLELPYLGGAVDGESLAVAELWPPPVGEKGIYFVESLGRLQVHPLYGWQQGHYRVEADPKGRELIRTFSGQAIYGLDLGQEAGDFGLSDGVAAGVRRQANSRQEPPLTVLEFKQRLRDLGSHP